MAKFYKTADCKNCGLKLNLFCYLSNEQLEHINDKRSEVRFQAGETIFKTGEPMTHILCLTSGKVKVYLEEGSNKKILLSIVKPVQLLGGPGFLTDERHYVTATALEESTACYISTKDFKKVMKINPEFSLELVRYLNQRIISYMEKMNFFAHKNMHGKLADTFLYLSNEIYRADNFKTALSRQDLADMSSMTKESAIRVMKEFKDEGIINYNTTHFEILNKDALINISRTG
jgi:CRP/FNR family transcriptional regulator